MAQVRWYLNAAVEMNDERLWHINDFGYGKLSDDVAELPIYDLAARQPLLTSRGGMAVISPAPIFSSTILPSMDQAPRELLTQTNDAVSQIVSVSSSGSRQASASALDIFWFGEITKSCLDGDVVVRLGAAQQARDIKVPADRVIVVVDGDGSSDSEDGDFSNGSDWSDEMSVSATDTDTSSDRASTIDVAVEYEGGARMTEDDQDDEEMWSTDEGEDTQLVPVFDIVKEGDDTLATTDDLRPTTLMGQSTQCTDRGPITYSSYPSVPQQFSILGCSPPQDHHYFDTGTARTMTADVIRRISKENAIMQSSLPDGVFIRCWESRFDLLRILVVGPYETPYEFAPFVFDLQYGAAFPQSPPNIFFHSWANEVGRINPNLYEDGKVCLSLLGTWDGHHRSEEWSSKKSTVLQLIVSIMGLVLVKEPYFSK